MSEKGQRDGGAELLRLIRERITVEGYDPDRGLSDDEVRELIDDVTHTPSSFNIQHWRFVAVRDPAAKTRLMEAAYGQVQVGEAAVTFILLGDLRAIERLPELMRRAVSEGALDENRARAWIDNAQRIYADPAMSRDEAIRSCSLAAMTLMLAAEARGLGSGALVGFDPERVRRDFAIAERYLPVMLITVGHPRLTGEGRKPRLTVDEVLAFDRAEFEA